jgi:hypothetical protein
MLLHDTDRVGNRRVDSVQTERAANETKEVACRFATQEALLVEVCADDDCSDRHKDEATMLIQRMFGLFRIARGIFAAPENMMNMQLVCMFRK